MPPDGPPRPAGRRRRRRRPRHAADQAPAATSPLPPQPLLDPTKPAVLPLSAAERAELKQHLAFIARHREVLRLKINAAENLLLTGAREPEDRGVCLHLLGKIDRPTVQAALARLREPEEKTRLLAGLIRFTRDVAILVLYLESLSASASRAEAAAALVAALRRIDWTGVSAAQLRRLLELVATLVGADDRPHLLLSLLGNDSFRATFDDAAAVLPPDLAALLEPIRAAWALLFGDAEPAAPPAVLHAGVRLLLASPTAHLADLPEEARGRLIDRALDLCPLPPDEDGALAALLDTLPPDTRRTSQLATRRARALLRAERDAEARALLERLAAAQPGYRLPGRWLQALAAPRLERVALSEASDAHPPAPGWHRGLWLARPCPVWVLVGPADQRQAVADGAALHAQLALPGIAPLVTHGAGALPFVAVPLAGEPAVRGLRALRGEPTLVLTAARAGVELLNLLALVGVELPDARLERFLADPQGRLTLASLAGARRSSAGAAPLAARHLALARTLCTDVLDLAAGRRAFAGLRAPLAAAADLVTLARALTAGE